MIRPGTVKICSLREELHAEFVAEASPDLFGLIFVAGVRREITPDKGRAIVQAVRAAAPIDPPKPVGVFLASDAARINRIAETADLVFVQVVGVTSAAEIESIERPVIVVIRIAPDESLAVVETRMTGLMAAAKPPVAFIVDGFHATEHGGSGVRADWRNAAELASRWPVILAGGLSPDTVANGIETVRPLGVDVSTGVETDGIKDREKILRFVRNARLAFG